MATFIARYGKPEVRLRIVERMLNIDRQESERARVQSTAGIGRTAAGKIAKATEKKRATKKNDD